MLMSADTRPPSACLAGRSRPDGVFCANDILAIGFMDAARREFGLDIPGDLSVVGFDDIAMAHWPSHALTTVRQPVGKMIDVTMELIGLLFGSTQLDRVSNAFRANSSNAPQRGRSLMPSSGRDMLDRAALVHRWDCPAVAEPALPEPEVAEVDAAAAATLRRPYDALAPADRAGGGIACSSWRKRANGARSSISPLLPLRASSGGK